MFSLDAPVPPCSDVNDLTSPKQFSGLTRKAYASVKVNVSWGTSFFSDRIDISLSVLDNPLEISKMAEFESHIYLAK